MTLRKSPWLNGWRRLWIVWSVVACAGWWVFVFTAWRPGESSYVLVLDHKYEAEAEARRRFHARESSLSGRLSDEKLDAEVRAIERDYQPIKAEAWAQYMRDRWTATVGGWLLLVGGAYAAGAAAAWVRRGFS